MIQVEAGVRTQGLASVSEGFMAGLHHRAFQNSALSLYLGWFLLLFFFFSPFPIRILEFFAHINKCGFSLCVKHKLFARNSLFSPLLFSSHLPPTRRI